ncbi:uncharacterized protein LOC123307884 [Coccinella septempunctata]|uniref:uncharacterized protein LOC123307884 n=1 Tax=Coccinella septempunctata TaxID=41139 RepID=UPI001D06C737|nr:uncharacterized protein LOC123307884 [Coccinella septempunctata]
MLHCILTISVLLSLLLSVHGLLGNECNIYDLRSELCGELEICDENTNSCQCAPGYNRVENSCKKAVSLPTPNGDITLPNNSELVNHHTSTSISGVLMFIFIIFINIIIVVYVVKRFNLVHWMRNKINSWNRSNYDEFMIGRDVDDDPPLR